MPVYHAGESVAFMERSITQPQYHVKLNRPAKRFDDPYSIPRPDRGTRTLEATALKIAVKHAADLTTKTLECLPWPIAEKIWDKIHPMPFTIWKTFVNVYAREASESRVLDGTIIQRSFSLPRSLEVNTAWLTELSIHTGSLTFEDMIGLSCIPSLAILLLSSQLSVRRGSNSEVDDRLVRNWSRAAKEDGAFKDLRILSLHGCRYITMESLAFLHELSSLDWIYFDDCLQMPLRDFYRDKMLTTDDHEGWEFHDIATEVFPQTFPHQTFSDLVYSSAQAGTYQWSQWHRSWLRYIQSLDARASNFTAEHSNYNKPSLSIVCGPHPAVLAFPLMYKRTNLLPTSSNRNEPAQMENRANVKVSEIKSRISVPGTKRQIKKRKFEEMEEDWSSLMGG